ncbi:hypothetical protein [Arenimonas sp. MALMAid1274]
MKWLKSWWLQLRAKWSKDPVLRAKASQESLNKAIGDTEAAPPRKPPIF